MLPFIFLLFSLSSVAAFKAIRFSSIQQCGPFNVTFSGNKPAALPLTLTVVPFGSSAVPLSIPLPNSGWDSKTSTGVAITFLPYPAGTTFIASLDDAQGRSTGFTSDIIRILQSDNTSCVSTAKQTQTYAPEPPFSQCQPFNVTFDPSQTIPPTARLFVPNGQAFSLNQTQGSTDPGTSAFTMLAFRGQSVILLFEDGMGRLQSTNLLTVIGDMTSSNSCFPIPQNDGDSEKSQQVGLSRQAVIGIVASIASVVALLSILVAVHLILRWRRSRRIRRAMQRKGIEGGTGPTESRLTPLPDSQSPQASWNAIVINKPTPYPMEKYTSRPASPYLAQAASNGDVQDRYRQIQSLNDATADLDQILNASVFISHGGDGPWSSSLSPSTPHSQDVRDTVSSTRIKEQPNATVPVSPLSSTSNFRDSIITASHIQAGGFEVYSGTVDGGGSNVARRSSTTVVISGQGITDRGRRDGFGDPYL